MKKSPSAYALFKRLGNRTFYRVFFSSISCLFLISCATITSGRRAVVILNSDVEEPVDIKTDYKLYEAQKFPAVVEVKRGRKTSQIEFSSENHIYKNILVTKKTNGWIWGNVCLFIGAPVGLALDYIDGAAWEPAKKTFYVNAITKYNNEEIVGIKSNSNRQSSMDSDVDRNIPAIPQENALTFVVIIANEKYDNESPVAYAINDGRIFKKYCTQALGIPEKNIHLLENATLNNMRSEIDWLERITSVYDGDVRLIIYYAGHGIPDETTGSAYLLPVDGVGTNVQSGYSLKSLYTQLGKMKSKNITVFMDACFSGAQRGEGMLAYSRGVAIKAKEEKPTGNLVVFSATQGDETAFPYDEKGHGLFTYFLLKKLQETGGDVNYQDLANYLKKEVSRHAIVVNNKPQTPSVSTSDAMTGRLKSIKLR